MALPCSEVSIAFSFSTDYKILAFDWIWCSWHSIIWLLHIIFLANVSHEFSLFLFMLCILLGMSSFLSGNLLIIQYTALGSPRFWSLFWFPWPLAGSLFHFSIILCMSLFIIWLYCDCFVCNCHTDWGYFKDRDLIFFFLYSWSSIVQRQLSLFCFVLFRNFYFYIINTQSQKAENSLCWYWSVSWG